MLRENIREKTSKEKCHECGKILHKRYVRDMGFNFCSLDCVKKDYFERGIQDHPLSL